jgi:DNA-binding NtrC family response regulator
MKDGAYDYLTKPLDPARLQVLLERALDRAENVREVHRLRRELRHRGAFGSLVAGAPAMQEVTRQIEQVAPTDATVLVLGESGTGKELVARTIHDHSPRRRAPFVAVNCAAIPETLLESEIFGHERGSFTGATGRRPGCFELADGGTLFLDEIAEMNPATQVKFLRVLQDGRFRRVGGQSEIAVDVRVVAATNKNPAKALQDGMLREDLYYRIAVFALALPPLRDRLGDLEELVRVLLEELDERHHRTVRGVDEATLALFRRYAWPGNVRELRNVLERAVIVCPGEVIEVAHLPSPPAAVAVSAEPGADQPADDVRLSVGTTVDEAERRLIVRTLAYTGNNKTRAAEILGISLKTLHNKLNRYSRSP